VKKLFKSRWFWIVAGVLVIGGSAFGMMQGKKGKTQQVTVATARTKDVVQKVKAPGLIEPRTVVKISADIPGRVIHLRVREGDVVKRGQLLLELDNTQYAASVSQSQASLESARARLERAQTTWKIQETNYSRRKALFERKLLSTQEMDQAENEYASARTELSTAREEVSRIQAVLRGDRDRLAKMTYHSPIDGKIVALNIEEGEIVVVGTMNNPGTQILTVADLSRMLVKADVDETDVVDVRPGQAASIKVDAMPDTTFQGTVTEVGNSATASATAASGETNFEVKVLFSETVEAVRPGMTADVEIEVRRSDKALAVPIQSVVVRQPDELTPRGQPKKDGKPAPKGGDAIAAQEQDGEPDPAERKKSEITGVFVMGADGKALFRKVKTGISSETDIEIQSGELKSGEKVVTGPYKVLRELKPGDLVEVQKRPRGGAGAQRRG
jgi:HlyD family secretion protein